MDVAYLYCTHTYERPYIIRTQCIHVYVHDIITNTHIANMYVYIYIYIYRHNGNIARPNMYAVVHEIHYSQTHIYVYIMSFIHSTPILMFVMSTRLQSHCELCHSILTVRMFVYLFRFVYCQTLEKKWFWWGIRATKTILRLYRLYFTLLVVLNSNY